jgi:hypothetical protein
LLIHAHLAHAAQRFGVGADEDVLAVVQHQRAAIGQRHGQRPRPAAHGARGFEDGGLVSGLGQFQCGGQAGPARAQNGDVHGAA